MFRVAHGQEGAITRCFDSMRGSQLLVLDAEGLNCALPIREAKKALQGVRTAGRLEICATDPGAVKDFEGFCRATGNELVVSSQEGNIFKFVVKRLKQEHPDGYDPGHRIAR